MAIVRRCTRGREKESWTEQCGRRQHMHQHLCREGACVGPCAMGFYGGVGRPSPIAPINC